MNLILDLEAAAKGAGVGASTVKRWLKLGLIQPVSETPRMFATDDLVRVRDQCDDTRRGNLRQYRVRLVRP